MSDVALSTMWGIGKFPTLADFFNAAGALGFTRFELNHAVDSAMLKNVNGYCIMSVHEPCPADVSIAALKECNWLISAPAEDKRRKGVEAVRRSIDLAQQLGAPVVIVHPGKVDIDSAPESKLREWYREGKTNTLVVQQHELAG